ncbi:hypothetical protein CGCSCA4_v004591 [Colletotrichum siamense]|uniref:Uncharacterized protein n=1 Tax=Colletotrichum siamense TaxID=690259 RepID=A0A9P5K6Y2_COLSI|nr:hypothetical protein CGCSCA4_v004591 [Colletotrichum siamense]KAF4861518.1 hypothetical protein CGCSCA2_v004357 [Colletotrichum siamense]
MTKSLRGSSLPQARSYHHNHYHLHNKRAASHENAIPHQHHRRQTDTDEADNSPTPESASSSSSSSRKVVVQTVSIVQVVDASGAPIEVQTHYAPPATVDADTSPSASASADLGLSIAAVSTTETSTDITSETATSSSDSSLSTPPATTSSTTPSPAGSSTSQDIPLTSNPLSSVPASIPYVNKFIFYISPYRNHFNKPVFVRFDERNIFSAFIHFIGFRFIFWFNYHHHRQPQHHQHFCHEHIDSSSGDDSAPSTGTVVGSVVGSVAGVAFLVLLAFLALRWKKRSGGRLRLSEVSAKAARGILTGSGGPDSGSRPGMTQRAVTFGSAAIGGAAAAAKPHSRRASEPSETGERGFVRVAGRKLPSVLQAGGDGYTDPREAAGDATANDDESVYYRDSRAFFEPGGAGQTRLALGSPMRPVSGVITMQPGPARTPVTESAPFPAPPDSTLSPPRDPIGRTLNSQDGSRGSRGSVSRFQEDM